MHSICSFRLCIKVLVLFIFKNLLKYLALVSGILTYMIELACRCGRVDCPPVPPCGMSPGHSAVGQSVPPPPPPPPPPSRPGALGSKLVRPMMGVATYPGRVREGGAPPAQPGGMGERCKLPHRGLGLRPRSKRFFCWKNSESYAKKAAFKMILNDIGLIIISHIVYTGTICGPD